MKRKKRRRHTERNEERSHESTQKTQRFKTQGKKVDIDTVSYCRWKYLRRSVRLIMATLMKELILMGFSSVD